MTADQFRRIALGFPEAVESSHLGHPDFRLGGKVFATLGYPHEGFGMVRLPPDEQRRLIVESPSVFTPCVGVWGQRGATSVHLASATVALVRPALTTAWQFVDTPPKRKRV